jgi:glycosyltransferase involved in cell wall biosynthesis
MKIAFITTNLRGGGAEKAVINLASILADRGHEVHVILLERVVEHALPGNFALHALATGKLGKGVLGKYLCAFRLARLVKRLAKGAPFELIVSTLPFADEVVALSGIEPVWYRIANTLSSEVAQLKLRHPGKAARRYQRYRRLYGAANVIAVSEGVAEDLRDCFQMTQAGIEQIYNPFDVAAINELAAQPEPDLPQAPYLLHVGRFAPQKRHDLLLRAWEGLDDTEHKLVFLTKKSEQLDALIEASGLGSRVMVAGFRQNPYPWIKNAQLLVLCSDREGMPNVLVEALACGTPVVSTDCPSGPRELLAGTGSGVLVPTGDVEALRAAIRAALQHPAPPCDADLAAFEAGHVAERYEALPGLWRDRRSL